jgi:hypothetical protein
MRKCSLNAVMAGFAIMLAAPLGARAQVAWETDCVSEKIALPERSRDPASITAAEVTVGKRLKVRCRFFLETSGERRAVSAGAVIDNQNNRPMHYVYSVAFFDADNKLIAAATRRSSPSGIPGNGSETVDDVRVFGPGAELAKIRSAQVRVYESELPIGEG